MIELLLYEYWSGNLAEEPVLKLSLGGCFDPEDQDHAGINFQLRIDIIEGATLFDSWSDESAFDDYFSNFATLESGQQTVFRIPPENDHYIIADHQGDCVHFTIFLCGVITARTDLTIASIGVSVSEFDHFIKDFESLLESRRERDRLLGFNS